MRKLTPWLERLFLRCSARVFEKVFDIVRSQVAAEEIVMTVFEKDAGELQGVDLEAGCRAIYRGAFARACADGRFIKYLDRRVSSKLEDKDRAYEASDLVSYLSELVHKREDLGQIEFPRQWLVTCARNWSFDLKKAGLSFNFEDHAFVVEKNLLQSVEEPDETVAPEVSKEQMDKFFEIFGGVKDPKGRLVEIFENARESGQTLGSLLDCIHNLVEQMRIDKPVRADVIKRLFLGESVSDTSHALGTSVKTIENHRTAAYRDLQNSCGSGHSDASLSELAQRDTPSFDDD